MNTLKKVVLTVVAFLAFCQALSAQQTIRGKVTDQQSGSGIPGATVAVKNGQAATQTNQNGLFEIREVKPGTYKLVIEAIAPYKNFEKDGVVVDERKETNVGEISLQQ